MSERHIVKIIASVDLRVTDSELQEEVTDLEEAKQALIENACDDCCTWQVEWSNGDVEVK